MILISGMTDILSNNFENTSPHGIYVTLDDVQEYSRNKFSLLWIIATFAGLH